MITPLNSRESSGIRSYQVFHWLLPLSRLFVLSVRGVKYERNADKSRATVLTFALLTRL